MENEIWKDIPDYKGLYQVSDLGRVKSLARTAKHSSGGIRVVSERILKEQKHFKGYRMVSLNKKGKAKTFNIHQLVMMAFEDFIPCKFQRVIDHKNGIRHDNRLVNLEIVTMNENIGRGYMKKETSSKYTGVCKFQNGWVARMNSKHLGFFLDEMDAHAAYQHALLKHNLKTKPFQPLAA